MNNKLREIWNTYNVSTILILPLFQHLISDVKSKKNEKLNIIGFLIENGLINTYLFNTNINKDYFCLTLSFTYKVMDQIEINKIYYPSLLDILINSKEFEHIFWKNNVIDIILKIDKIWDNDINKITSSLYSTVSEEYKKKILFTGLCKDSGDISNFLHSNNIPARIVYKSKKLEEVLIDLFYINNKDNSININSEYYESFDIIKETI